MQQKVRPIMKPATEGTHFTLEEARATFLEIRRERLAREAEEAKARAARRKRGPKAR